MDALSSLRSRENEILIAGFNECVRAPCEAKLEAIADASDSIEVEARETHGIGVFLDHASGSAYRERLSFAPTANVAASTAATAAQE